MSNYGIENYVDIVNGKTDKIECKQDQTSKNSQDFQLMEWWKKLVTKRYNKLKEEDRLRKDLEVGLRKVKLIL